MTHHPHSFVPVSLSLLLSSIHLFIKCTHILTNLLAPRSFPGLALDNNPSSPIFFLLFFLPISASFLCLLSVCCLLSHADLGDILHSSWPGLVLAGLTQQWDMTNQMLLSGLVHNKETASESEVVVFERKVKEAGEERQTGGSS